MKSLVHGFSIVWFFLLWPIGIATSIYQESTVWLLGWIFVPLIAWLLEVLGTQIRMMMALVTLDYPTIAAAILADIVLMGWVPIYYVTADDF
jgi:hypothetical protein